MTVFLTVITVNNDMSVTRSKARITTGVAGQDRVRCYAFP